jgi:hypothetical protein
MSTALGEMIYVGPTDVRSIFVIQASSNNRNEFRLWDNLIYH